MVLSAPSRPSLFSRSLDENECLLQMDAFRNALTALEPASAAFYATAPFAACVQHAQRLSLSGIAAFCVVGGKGRWHSRWRTCLADWLFRSEDGERAVCRHVCAKYGIKEARDLDRIGGVGKEMEVAVLSRMPGLEDWLQCMAVSLAGCGCGCGSLLHVFLTILLPV
jgi:hypothetical protein